MANDITLDSALKSTRFALDGLSERQKVISQNLANVDTPGYQARNLNFESALRLASTNSEKRTISLLSTNPRHLQISTTEPGMTTGLRSGGSQRADGNNVDIDVELTEMSEVGIEYQALTQAASKKLQLLKAIATSR